MRRALLIVVLAISVALVGIATGLMFTARGDDTAVGKPARPIVVTARVEPSVHAFGEPVVATVAVEVDPLVVDPDTVQIDPDFGFYEQFGPRVVERRDGAEGSTFTYRYRLHCLREGCEPLGARQAVTLPLSRIGYVYRGATRRTFSEIDWPAVSVTGRVDDADVARIAWHASTARVPEPSYRVDPVDVAVALLLLAAALAVGGGWLAWRLLRVEREQDGIETVVVRRSPLELALERASTASEGGDAAGAKVALERVARELAGAGEPTIAARARALAWSPNGSYPLDMDELRRLVADVATRQERT